MFDLMNTNNDLMKDFFGSMMPAMKNGGMLRADVVDDKDHYTVTVDAPGFDKKDMKLRYADNVLTISGQRDTLSDHSDKNGNIISSERAYGSVSRQFRLPNVDTKKISAKYIDGVLTITLPKLAPEASDDGHIEIEQ